MLLPAYSEVLKVAGYPSANFLRTAATPTNAIPRSATVLPPSGTEASLMAPRSVSGALTAGNESRTNNVKVPAWLPLLNVNVRAGPKIILTDPLAMVLTLPITWAV